MAEIKTREKFKGIKALDKAAVAGERMKRAFVRAKDQEMCIRDRLRTAASSSRSRSGQ